MKDIPQNNFNMAGVEQSYIRSWHVTEEELDELGWDEETIKIERQLNGNPSHQVLRYRRNFELSQIDVNSIEYVRVLRYYNIIMEKLIDPEE